MSIMEKCITKGLWYACTKDYEKLGGEEGKKILDELATKGYERERCVEQITRIHDRNKSKD